MGCWEGQVLVGLLAGATARDVIAGYLHAALATQASRVVCVPCCGGCTVSRWGVSWCCLRPVSTGAGSEPAFHILTLHFVLITLTYTCSLFHLLLFLCAYPPTSPLLPFTLFASSVCFPLPTYPSLQFSSSTAPAFALSTVTVARLAVQAEGVRGGGEAGGWSGSESGLSLGEQVGFDYPHGHPFVVGKYTATNTQQEERYSWDRKGMRLRSGVGY